MCGLNTEIKCFHRGWFKGLKNYFIDPTATNICWCERIEIDQSHLPG